MNLSLSFLLIALFITGPAFAEFEEDESSQQGKKIIRTKSKSESYHYKSETKFRTKEDKKKKRKYFSDDDPRVDAGTFHVGFGAGGNFYIEPQFNKNTGAPLGSYFRDFGFQGGVYFDYDYEDINLGLRGYIGYKYLLTSVHAFAFEGTVRYLIRFSENAKFGLGVGSGAGIWFRQETSSTTEEIIFLPALIVAAGFDFTPFLVDFKFLINRIGQDATLLGMELSFGVRL